MTGHCVCLNRRLSLRFDSCLPDKTLSIFDMATLKHKTKKKKKKGVILMNSSGNSNLFKNIPYQNLNFKNLFFFFFGL